MIEAYPWWCVYVYTRSQDLRDELNSLNYVEET